MKRTGKRATNNNKEKKKKIDGISQKQLQQNLHNKHNFLKHTIIIYPHYENSMIKKKKKNFLKTKIQSYFLGTTKQSASLGCTAPIDHSIKVAQFKYIDTVEGPLHIKGCDKSHLFNSKSHLKADDT